MSGKRFEEEVAYFYSQLGYKAKLTPHSNDKGIDINLEKDGKKIIVQCKAHKVRIGPAAVRELYGTLIASGADMAILATFEGVSSGASSFIKDKPIKVITIDNIIAMRKKLNTTDTKF
jgi:restriction system protein